MTPGRRLLRWLAPLSSTALFAYLLVRVSGCNLASAPPEEPQVSSTEGEGSTTLPTPVAPDAAAPSLADTPVYFQRPNSLEFLGATKAAPMVIGESLREQGAREPPASEPAVQQGEP